MRELERARAAAAFPGTSAPSKERDPSGYDSWVRSMALWGYQYGPLLLANGGKP